MKIKKLLTVSLLAICLLVMPVLLSACGDESPKDKPYIKSTGNAVTTATSVSRELTIVNPTNKVFMVAIKAFVEYKLGAGFNAQTGKWNNGYSSSRQTSATIEIAAKETKKYTMVGYFESGASSLKHSFSISGTYEKTAQTPTQTPSELLVGSWQGTAGGWSFYANNTYIGVGNYGSGVWSIVGNTLHLTRTSDGLVIDLPFGFQNNNNTIWIDDQTYNRLG